MKYFYSISISGQVDERDGESIEDIQDIVHQSFPHKLVAGVTMNSYSLSVQAVPDLPSPSVAQGSISQMSKY